MKVRSLPILLILLSTSLISKVSSFSLRLYHDNKQNKIIKINSLLIEEAQANEHKSEHKSSDDAHKSDKDEAGSHHTENSEQKKDNKPSPENHPLEQLQPTDENQKFLNLNCNPQLNEYSPEAIKLLQNLAERRKELEAKTKEIDLKNQLLQATELQINDKLVELKNLKTQVEGLLSQYNDKENQKILSLVKIYEAMKPQEAAKIFDSLDMSVLLQVINQMKEAKVALVLAKMNPIKAREVSMEFANQKKITDKAV